MPRVRRSLLFALAALAAGAALRGAVALVEAALEGRVQRELVAASAARGFEASVGQVRVRLPFRASLRDVTLRGHGAAIRLDFLGVRLGLFGRGKLGRLRRVELGALDATLPHGVALRLAPSSWDVSVEGEALRIAGRAGEGSLLLERPAPSGGRLRLDRVDLRRLVLLRRDGDFVGDLGIATGVVSVAPAGAGLAVETNLLFRRVRLAAPPGDDGGPAALGEAFDAEGSASGVLYRDDRLAEVDCVAGSAAGLRGTGRAVVAWAPRDAWLDVAFEVPWLELAPLLSASGLDLAVGEGDLGSAEVSMRVTGRMLDPKSIVVEERLDFRPPARPLPELQRLRGPFRRVMTGRDGREVLVAVDPESPDFVPIEEVPPLFIRALLTSEDANFWGHPGLDLSEIPVAMSINWVRGERSRGASTITQQLAKNLFLSRERSYRRKLQEAALALLLEPSLGKKRILEIYLNVIEWGPGIHGIGPAARHYFGKSPSDLTPRESAFLVALIPGPVKYQPSFASGVLTRGFSRLVNGVLYRLRSVDMLTDEELHAELAAPLRLRWTPPDAAGEEEPGVAAEGEGGAGEADAEAAGEPGDRAPEGATTVPVPEPTAVVAPTPSPTPAGPPR